MIRQLEDELCEYDQFEVRRIESAHVERLDQIPLSITEIRIAKGVLKPN